MLHLQPHAKVNLGLLIKGKRPDGYHLLETLLVPIPSLTDDLWLTPNDTGSCQLTLEGISIDGDLEDNLCVKAYRALQAIHPDLPGVDIRLRKGIPAGAGLGGGSSDAAHVMLGLNELFDLGMSPDDLAPLAGKLGADVPFFLFGKPLLASGIGTDFEEVDIQLPFDIQVFPQSLHVSTISAYKALDYRMFDPDRNLLEILQQPIEDWKELLPNDLEIPVFQLHPSIGNIKQDLYDRGAIYASMSGSGSAFFGLFPNHSA
ncbi:4-(cytidine 5'-diphospho)-2-C-methyl-D-erythritol kinase [Pontibacter sp. G13]|uniref:4-(cytidine 5'-diphospho)-2-C-methyl-D-erythritol kinase n=1 Tax=Pontibacter sp. G13 TaxID=3074898 RepID=UPI002889CCFC|nr:4-(cytidine 5'-diphospho)-2-C-methyl-D-erythritol kinase [Pontibacter sp. G13]WNJ16621.1 4-(cytidine 5'-diphospho)-2-C-methyl-D-erythritol kinase [Pontibacter sp. G13]